MIWTKNGEQVTASYNEPNVISVAATDNQDNLAGFSDYGGTSVNLGGPGVNVFSTSDSSDSVCPGQDYCYLSGTSMATPHVAGTAELSESVCGGDTEWLKPNILDNVVLIPSLNGKTTTGGLVNAYNSVYAASNACPGTGAGDMGGTEASRYIGCPSHCVLVYATGTITLTVNGASEQVSYGQGSTAASLATDLYNAINGNSSYPVRAHLLVSPTLDSGFGEVTLGAKTTGSGTNYTLSESCQNTSQYFSGCTFSLGLSGSALTGGK